MKSLISLPIYVLTAVSLFSQTVEPDSSNAGNDQVAEVIKNFESRGTLADDTPPTSPADAVKNFRVRDGFEIELVASEPDIAQPLHISWDSKGRMWVTQYLQYQFPAGLKIVEYDNHLRAQFDKVPQPPPHGVKGADKITVFEDTTGDGKYDSHRDVITGLNLATSAVHGAGGIWVTNPPYLLFYPDADGDATPDGDPEVKLSGFGIEDTHSVMNSLKWGPDGWLYGANGSTTTGEVKDPATGEVVKWQGQMIWRFHPHTEKFEIYAEGGGNTFSVEIDSKGRVFSGSNFGRTRGMYYPQGAYGKKGWGKHGPLTNPYAFGYINHMPHKGDDRRFAQAFCIYEGGLFPPDWEGKIIAANSLHNIVWVSKLLPDGSTFKTVDEAPLVETDDRWFRPVFCGVGPDGCVYIADWYDTRLSHVRPVDDWHKTSGRIYRIKPTGTDPKIPAVDLSEAGEFELLTAFANSTNWTNQKRILLESEWRAETIKRSPLPKDAIDGNPSVEQIFWSSLGTDFHFWTLNLIPKNQKESYRSLLKIVLEREASPKLTAGMASSAKRIGPELGLEVLTELLSRDNYDDDPHIPLLIWWAIEEHAETGRKQIEELAADPKTWKSKIFREFIAERLMRRYAMAGGEANFTTAAKLLESAPDDDAKSRLMTGLQLAFQGATIPDYLPPALTEQLDKFANSMGENALILAVKRGDADALTQALAAVADHNAKATDRLELARAFGEINDPTTVSTLLKVLGYDQQSALKRVALQSLSNYEAPAIPKTILARLGSTLPREHDVASTAHRVLAGRTNWANLFLENVENATIKARHVSPDVVQLLAQHNDPKIDAAIAENWPELKAKTSEDNQKEIDRIKAVLAVGNGDATAGKTHFTARCSACHKLFEEGNTIGPDLTGYDRQSLDFWLPAIIDPSLEIREGFIHFIATADDGQVSIGMIADETPDTVTLRDAANQKKLINRASLKSLKASPVSPMPPGLLGGLTDDEMRDLFAYLKK